MSVTFSVKMNKPNSVTSSHAWQEAYDRYLQSPAWLEKRRQVLARTRGICEGCGARRAVEVHHRFYPRCDCLPGEPAWIRAEKLFDLAAVCLACHQDLHPGKKNSPIFS
jgi:hypothetical protein